MFRNQSLRLAFYRGGLLVLGLVLSLATQAADTDRVYAAEAPDGTVRVLALVGQWPAGGLRIEDGHGALLLDHVAPDVTAQAALDASGQRSLAAARHPPTLSPEHAQAAQAILALRLVSDWNFARAAGLGVVLPRGMHPSSVRVVLLEANGAPKAVLAPVAVAKDAGPLAPALLHAEASSLGIALNSQIVPQVATVPAYAYVVGRDAADGHAELTPQAQLLPLQKTGQTLAYVERAPPVNATLSYTVRLVDALGIPGAPATVKVYSPDFEAGKPPTGQHAKAEQGVVNLSWNALTNPRTRALVVERAQLVSGPYEIITPKGIAASATHFDDRLIQPGASYFYRLRAVMPDGDMGPAADPVEAQPMSASNLPAPQGLAAKIGISQIMLSWQAVPGVSLAGYFIERREVNGSPRWFRLNRRLLPEPHYLDAVGPSEGGGFEYRVTAVATDEGVSPASAVLRVVLRDTQPPAAPHVVSASGADGQVLIRFNPAEPAARTAQVALLRFDSATEAGLVVGAPVPGNSGMIRDDWVNGGQVYWYRLVAFDQAGNRGEQGEAFQVRVAAPPLPTPKAPQVIYSAQPAPQVNLSFDPPPPHARIVVEVQREDGRWQKVAGPLMGNSASDSAPPGAHARYRLVYVEEKGGSGMQSPAVAAP